MKTVIIGKGKVGEATAMSLSRRDPSHIDFHDPHKGVSVETVGGSYNFAPYDYAIVCVDTLRRDEYDHTDVISVLNELKTGMFTGIALIRSTVNPEIIPILKNIYPRFVMFPEFMRQTDDLKMDDPWVVVLGGEVSDVLTSMWYLHDNGYCDDTEKYLRGSHADAAIIKLCQNAGLATKVIFFNMVYALCEKYQGNYDLVRRGVGADKRVGIEYSVVPSPDDGLRGFKGHCLPKDVASLSAIDDYGFFAKLLEINKQLGR